MIIKTSINLVADNTDEAKEIHGYLQATINTVDKNDLKKLLKAVSSKPNLVKKVLPFV